ncbi:MAG: hypothetical protein IIZ94_01570 [Prevotella sp.]|nr:hypothetical protein [Prevotella sp.]
MWIFVGGWCSANNWWERSPNISNSTNFNAVNAYGNINNNNNASNVNGVVPGFSSVTVTTHKGEANKYTEGEGELNRPSVTVVNICCLFKTTHSVLVMQRFR